MIGHGFSVGAAILNLDLSHETVKTLLDVAQTGLIIVGGLIAGRTYLRDSAVKKAEWLERLHDKFFLTDEYKRIRQVLDYSSVDDYQSFIESINSEMANTDQEDLIDYLNFFHFISSLWKNGQLNDKEIKLLFDYYIRLLTKHDFIVNYMEREGFVNLIEMIDRFGYSKKCNHEV